MSEAILSDNSIICEERHAKEWTLAKVIYTGLMAFNLLSFLWLLATGSGIEMPPVIWIARIATALLAIYLGKLWKDKGFQILAIYTCLFFFRVLIPNPGNIFSAEWQKAFQCAVVICRMLWLGEDPGRKEPETVYPANRDHMDNRDCRILRFRDLCRLDRSDDSKFRGRDFPARRRCLVSLTVDLPADNRRINIERIRSDSADSGHNGEKDYREDPFFFCYGHHDHYAGADRFQVSMPESFGRYRGTLFRTG